MAGRNTKSAAGPDPREAYLQRHFSSWAVKLSAPAIDDLRFLGQRAKEGRPLTTKALTQWMLEKHGVKIGPARLATIAVENGIEPWWRDR
jgi:hypothetical protein